MSEKIYNNGNSHEIEKCDIIVTVDKEFESAHYEITFTLKKVTEGEDVFPIMSPKKGFNFINAIGPNKEPLDPQKDNLPNVARVWIRSKSPIAVGEFYTYTVCYENDISFENFENGRLTKRYGIILQRSFGSICRELTYEIKLEKKHSKIKHSVPRRNSNSKNKFHVTELQGGQPYSIALFIEVGIIPIWLQKAMILIATALLGYYVPKLFITIITWLTK